MPEIGYYALWLALIAALSGVAAGVAGGSGRTEWSEVARRAVWATFLLTATGVGALLYCLDHLRLPARLRRAAQRAQHDAAVSRCLRSGAARAARCCCGCSSR